MKYHKNGDVIFACDECMREAGSDPNENKALENARRVTKRDGWKWFHPGWGLTCPSCESSKGITISL